MSNVNIKRAIENIRSNTTNYTPVVEMIVNAIQAIDEVRKEGGKVSVRALRSDQMELDDSLSQITGFEIEDNGIGFTDDHRNSFDTLYTDHRISEGGKGFGRFICLKYFDDLDVQSVFRHGSEFKSRNFSMGKDHEIIVNETVGQSEKQRTGTLIRLSGIRKGPQFEKKLSTIARNLLDRLLPYFIADDYHCPEVEISESDGSSTLSLNELISNERSTFIKEISLQENGFSLAAVESREKFVVRIFKHYVPRNRRSRISLVAHNREVSGSVLHKYIPEFEEEFYEKSTNQEGVTGRNYIVKAYVFGDYLNRNVSLERGGFEFGTDSDLMRGISQTQIERKVADIARNAVGSQITRRQEKKRDRVRSYVDREAPWHKKILETTDLSRLPYNASDEQIEMHLQTEEIADEFQTKKDVKKLLSESSFEDSEENVVNIVNRLSDTSKERLIHYIVLRRRILKILDTSLHVNEQGKYRSEAFVHDIIFPRKGDTNRTRFKAHNLWIFDERLNFTDYVSSDVPLAGRDSGRPDLLVYNRRVLFRGDNIESNPITIFEFKRPQRDDFANPSSQDDPVRQIVQYVIDIQDGRFKTPTGRDIKVAENTPFYGFVVCDLTRKVTTWLERVKNFKPMPDGKGWFGWMENINLYVEVISWDKVVKDARMRNKIFFKKLEI